MHTFFINKHPLKRRIQSRVPSIRSAKTASQKGFTLLEVLVAFTLLAVSMGVLMQIFSKGVTGADVADRYAKAAMLAESKLATVGVEEALQEGETTGSFNDDFAWRLSVRPYVTTTEPRTYSTVELQAQAAGTLTNNPNVGLSAGAATQLGNIDIESLLPVRLFEVELAVAFRTDDGRERVVTLNTMKIGART
jgi:prepilin-type N-terminal cleavage/methylation domain-containing protein